MRRTRDTAGSLTTMSTARKERAPVLMAVASRHEPLQGVDDG